MATLLRKLIEATGLSRRAAFAAIRDGRVSVRGRRRTDPSSSYTGGALALDGAALRSGAPSRLYLMLNKPKDFLTTTADERGRPTVMDLLPPEVRQPGVFPVGRLDKDTSGLLILTNDGDLAHKLMHPSQGVEKEYWVALEVEASDQDLHRLENGVEVEGRLRRPLRLSRLKAKDPYTVSISISEGSKRQVRHMFEAVGHRVTELQRVREGPLRLGDLEQGDWRYLNSDEMKSLGLRGDAKD